MNEMIYCKKCVYPQVSVNLTIDQDGICSACKTKEKFYALTEDHWKERKIRFDQIIKEQNKYNKSNYDCIIPVSGGKDSYYQTHIITKEFNLKPLLMTYDGNNFLPEGARNRDRMKTLFNADHVMWSPSVDVLIKLNRIAFKKMGDMNWQNHCGIYTAPIISAVNFRIPLIIWGETEWDISGMYDPEDYVEFSNRVRQEHGLRGFNYKDFLDDPVDRLSPKDMKWAQYPKDEEIIKLGLRGLYIGNFFKWLPNNHVEMIKKKYDWQPSLKPFQRTYRNFSNLDDRYENGIHDLMKFIKFGYGRCSDHASKDIRDKLLTREKAVELVEKYDHVISDDLSYWLDYVSMKEEEFWKTADTFRDPRVWWIKNKEWYKYTLRGKPQAFGPVYLNKDQVDNFEKRQKKFFNK